MKRFNRKLIVLAAAATLVAGVAQAAEIFRAHYEISVAAQGADSTVRSTFETRPGEAFTLDLPPNVVALQVRRTGGESYELDVTVKLAKDQRAAPLFSHTYKGVLGRPLELANAAEAVKVDGAISVVVLNR
ncbi:MAG TPA: hypothetical protein VGE08_17585 [Steroidobacter sp.]|uniref:hypothetical protein n=1 Tax=Steroidobacter sp. TaxID=1978227 RepID=UPI002EDA60B5